MKKLLLILLYLPMIGFGQMFGSISSFTISPVNPNNTDTVYIYAELLFIQTGCQLDVKSYNIVGNNILASSLHCIGMGAAFCYTTDTFKLNPLLAGNYLFDFTLSSGSGPNCTAGILPDDNDVISFNVVTSVGIEEQASNKKLLKVTGLLGRATKQINQPLFYIYYDGTVEKRIVIE